MNGLERTRAFIEGRAVDRPPFHPIVMRWAARHAGIRYRDFCLDPKAKAGAMVRCADDFNFDWATAMSDPWAEASAFGVRVEYPEDDLPREAGGRLPDLEAAQHLHPYVVHEHRRTRNRVEEVRELGRLSGGRLFVVGWVEGPIAEYVDLRGAGGAALDLMDEPDAVVRVLDVIVEAALELISYQVKAGAHAIGIGDSFCSQIAPRLYRDLSAPREKRLVDHIHALGAVAKLHICGNTAPILPDMIATGADIIDADHLVPTLAPFAAMLRPGQVFSGKADPVGVVQDGTPKDIERAVREDFVEAKGRLIVSAGCEITPDTTADNMRAFRAVAGRLLGPVGA
jgi:MtaA/CmuA family methyltransferase